MIAEAEAGRAGGRAGRGLRVERRLEQLRGARSEPDRTLDSLEPLADESTIGAAPTTPEAESRPATAPHAPADVGDPGYRLPPARRQRPPPCRRAGAGAEPPDVGARRTAVASFAAAHPLATR